MSDGSPELRFLNPDTLVEQGRRTVTDGGAPVEELNELEFVEESVSTPTSGEPIELPSSTPTPGRSLRGSISPAS